MQSASLFWYDPDVHAQVGLVTCSSTIQYISVCFELLVASSISVFVLILLDRKTKVAMSLYMYQTDRLCFFSDIIPFEMFHSRKCLIVKVI